MLFVRRACLKEGGSSSLYLLFFFCRAAHKAATRLPFIAADIRIRSGPPSMSEQCGDGIILSQDMAADRWEIWERASVEEKQKEDEN